MTLNSLPQPYDWTFRRVVWATLVLVSVILGFWIFYRFNQVVFILFIAIVMGTVISPLVTWLHQRGLPRIAGVILVYILRTFAWNGEMIPCSHDNQAAVR